MASYQMNKTNYHDLNIYEVNKLPARSYFIPYETREAEQGVDLLKKRYQSRKVTCLNGDWNFKFYANPKDFPDTLDVANVAWDTIDVPSCWQLRGYDKPFYLNVRTQFPFKPPVIPTTEPVGKTFSWMGSDRGMGPRWQTPNPPEYNYVGVYARNINITDAGKTHILTFLGVTGAMDVYVNGAHVGYSEIAHSPAEFDITTQLVQGENELVVVVHRWSNSTYLECQDMFRNNGIFRDVLLYEMEAADFWDVDVKTKEEMVNVASQEETANAAAPEKASYTLDCTTELTQDAVVTITLEGHGIKETQQVQTKDKKATATFANLSVIPWNAEAPVLYDLYLEVPGSCIHKRIGFKHIEIQGNVYYLNHHKVKFRGVNHHDTHPKNGYAMTAEELMRDVLLCKEHNMDTIRTSHYPPDPMLLALCDELGIYVIDECDLETHATFAMKFPPTYNLITQDEKWLPRYMDRITRLYQRDKGDTCIVMWSLGNEAGGFHNTDETYQYLKSMSDIPVHYESVIHSKRKAYDIASEMYPPAESLHAIGEGSHKVPELMDRPYFLCEYGHAMGVGPGNIEAYWKEIYSYDNLLGGCIWEMVDHAILHEDGSYTYGGDHGEWMHDGNFCVDGLFYPDRTPSTGAKIVAHTYRPIRVTLLDNGKLELFNTMNFSNGDRYELKFTLMQGTAGDNINLQQVMEIRQSYDIKPFSKIIVDNPFVDKMDEKADKLFLNVETWDKGSQQVVAQEQLVLKNDRKHTAQLNCGKLPKDFDVVDGRPVFPGISQSGWDNSSYTLLFRAATDNDKDWSGNTISDPYKEVQEEVISCDKSENQITVTTRLHFKKHTFLCEDTYLGCEDGVILHSKLHHVKGKGNLPRFSKVFPLEATFTQVAYLGRNGESYCDMKEQTQIAPVQCKVQDMTEPNIKPQESGNRCDTELAILGDGSREIRFEAVNDAYELSVKPYSDVELSQMKHREDEKGTGCYVAINAFQMGIGTGSCGPTTAQQYLYPEDRDYEMTVLIRW